MQSNPFIALLKSPWNWACFAAMGVAAWASATHQPIIAFIASAVAVLRLAGLMGHATEEVAHHLGPRVGGFLNGSLGNAAELVIVIAGLREGLHEMVRASITGSMIGNLLLVFGASALAGGMKHPVQKFNRQLGGLNISLLMLAVMALFIPAIFHHGPHALTGEAVQNLSLGMAVLLFAAYLLSLFFSYKTHAHLFHAAGSHATEAGMSLKAGLTMLAAATAAVVWMSETMVHSMEPAIKVLGWSEFFVGIVFVALIGNAAEHATAIIMARDNMTDAALEISIGSSVQVALLVAPVAVFVSYLVGQPFSLEFNMYELGAIAAAVFTVGKIVQDGEINWLEGVLLLTLYAILGVAFFFLK